MARGWIGVDLDGTLAEYKGWKGATVIGQPVVVMLERVKGWLSTGRVVKIVTARVNPKSPDYLMAKEAIEAWTLQHLGATLEVTCEKDYDMIELYDDRAIRVEANTGRIL